MTSNYSRPYNDDEDSSGDELNTSGSRSNSDIEVKSPAGISSIRRQSNSTTSNPLVKSRLKNDSTDSPTTGTRRSKSTRSKKLIEVEIGVPFFLKWYPLITLAVSLTISMPVIWFKYRLAYNDETQLAIASFEGLATNLVQAGLYTVLVMLVDVVVNGSCFVVDASWQNSMLGAIVIANAVVSLNGGMTQAEYWRFTNSTQYFSYFSANSIVLSRYIEAGEDEKTIKDYLLSNYGPNLGSNDTFNFYATYPNNTQFISQNKPFYFANVFATKPLRATQRAAYGYDAWAEPLYRRPNLQYINETGNVGVTSRLALAIYATPTAGVIFMAPIFVDSASNISHGVTVNSSSSLSLSKSKTSRIYGAVFSAILGSDILNSALAKKNMSSQLHVFLFDVAEYMISFLDGDVNNTYLGHYSMNTHPVFDNYTLFVNLSEDDVLSMVHADSVFSYDLTTLQK
ncbi:hypothetical protein HDU76_007905 [Blyttiomyces sp. JEL0837]|nr:hypothetical protein HDU76_007905 [Blyttiomyces sp. JEL0837]